VRRAWKGLGEPLLVAGVAAVLRLQTAAASFETADERIWTGRSSAFGDAIASGHFGAASASPNGAAATMPGITTMWLGTLARGVWRLGGSLGLWSRHDAEAYGGATDFAHTRSGLNVAQVGMALVTAALLGLLVYLLAVWVGRTAALVAGMLMATEPFLVAHGAVLHTDELMSLTAVGALVAAALVLGLPRPGPWTGRRGAAVLVGVLYAAALLTKLTALFLLPPLVLLTAWAALDRERRAWLPRAAATALGAAAVTVLVTYPALWADPVSELRALRTSAGIGEVGHSQFFLGEATETPGLRFYLVALPFRVTPWLLLGTVAGVVALVACRRLRGLGAALLAMAAPPLVLLSLASKQIDRYGLPLLLLAAVAVGAGVAALVERLDLRRLGSRAAWALPAAGLLLVVNSLVVGPWGIAYFDPLLGGSSAAVDRVLVGWGEGYESAGALVARLEDGRCDGVVVSGVKSGAFYRCGSRPGGGKPVDYVVVYVNARQRDGELVREKIHDRPLVARHRIRGISYLEIYGRRGAPEPAEVLTSSEE